MLAIPPSSFREIQHDLLATPGGGLAQSKTVTAHATIHTKGSYTELVAATNFDVHWMHLVLSNTAVLATLTDQLVDIAIGAAGSEVVLLPDLLAGWSATLGATLPGGSKTYSLPIYIPKGTRVAARSQALITADTVDVMVFLYGGPSYPPWDTFVGCDAYGINTATSKGTAHTPGATGAESAWASIGGVTSRAYRALMFQVGGEEDTTANLRGYHWEIGYGSTTLGEFQTVTNSSEMVFGVQPPIPVFASIPSGTQLQVRAESSGTAFPHDCAIWGLY